MPILAALVCNICRQTITGPGDAFTPGAQVTEHEMARFFGSMDEHFRKQHPRECQFIDMQALQFKGLMYLMQFRTSDPRIKYNREFMRWQIHQATLDARLPDEKIAEQSSQLSDAIIDDVCLQLNPKLNILTAEDQETMDAIIARHISNLVTGLRELLQEPNPPSPPPGIQVVKG